MQKETPTDWAGTSTPKIFNGTRSYAPITDSSRWKRIYNILYQSQHVYKQIQDVNIGEIHFITIRVPNWTSVPLNEDQKLDQIEHCIVRIPIQPSVQ